MNIDLEKLSIFLSPITLALISLTKLTKNKYVYLVVLLLFLICLSLTILKLGNIILKKESLELYELTLIPTFCMAMMMFSNVLIYINYSLANFIWIIFFIMHISIIFLFTKFEFDNVRYDFIPGYMIVYVGILSASISGAIFNHQIITNFILLIGVTGLIYLIPKLVKYCICNKEIYNTPFKMIELAPFSLLYLGVKTNYEVGNIFLDIIFIFVLISTLYGLNIILHLKKQNFNLTLAALSFPLAINTIAIGSFISDFNIVFLTKIYFIYKSIVIIFVIVLALIFIFINIRNTLVKKALK